MVCPVASQVHDISKRKIVGGGRRPPCLQTEPSIPKPNIFTSGPRLSATHETGVQPGLGAEQIVEIMKLSVSTIWNYLKEFEKTGLSSYGGRRPSLGKVVPIPRKKPLLFLLPDYP